MDKITDQRLLRRAERIGYLANLGSPPTIFCREVVLLFRRAMHLCPAETAAAMQELMTSGESE